MNKSNNKEVVSLHPQNPRYFIYNGEPTVLITSTEHYGAVTNAAFKYEEYLDMLQSYGFNLSRVIVLMRETETDFKGYLGYQNTLCPTPENYVAPWKRSQVPGGVDGGNKFDLDIWNDAFFERLKDFCRKAGERGIIVEITFFNQYYNNKEDSPWTLSILNTENNINGVGATSYNRFNGCENKQLLERQEALVRKVVVEMKEFDNIYYEICNEPPYPKPEDPQVIPVDHPHVLGEKAISQWQNYVLSVIMDVETEFDCKHMISVGDPHESIDFGKFSIFNYHYRRSADAGLKSHYCHKKPLAIDETLTGIVSWNREMDFDGRRKEAWELFMSGFSVYDYLDFTIATDDPRGEGNAEFPGGYFYDGTMMRFYLKYLKDFIQSFDFIKMVPDNSVIKNIPTTSRAFALVEKGKAYAVYINGSALKCVTIYLPEGCYRAEWYNPITGNVDIIQENIIGGKDVMLELHLYHTDIALKIIAV